MRRANIVAWAGQPILVATPDVNLKNLRVWPWNLIGAALGQKGNQFFVLSYLRGPQEWGHGLHPRLMECLYRWLSVFGSPFAVVDHPYVRWPVPVPLQPWGPVGAGERSYWWPYCTGAYAAHEVRVPGQTSPLALGTVSTCDAEAFCHAWLKWMERTDKNADSCPQPDLLLVLPGLDSVFLGAYREETLRWPRLAAALRETCELFRITFVEEGPHRPVVVRPGMSRLKVEGPGQCQIAPCLVVRDIDAPSAYHDGSKDAVHRSSLHGRAPRSLSELAAAVTEATRDLLLELAWMFVYALSCLVTPIFLPCVARRLWRAGAFPFRLLNRCKNWRAFPSRAIRSDRTICRYMVALRVPRGDRGRLRRMDYYADAVVLAAALLQLGSVVCTLERRVAHLFLRLSGRTSLEAVRQPPTISVQRVVGWCRVMETEDLRWSALALQTFGLYDTIADFMGLSNWATPFLRDVAVVADERRAQSLLRRGYLARLVYTLRHWRAYRRVLASRVRAIAFDGCFVAVSGRYRGLFVQTLERVAHALGMRFEVWPNDAAKRS